MCYTSVQKCNGMPQRLVAFCTFLCQQSAHVASGATTWGCFGCRNHPQWPAEQPPVKLCQAPAAVLSSTQYLGLHFPQACFLVCDFARFRFSFPFLFQKRKFALYPGVGDMSTISSNLIAPSWPKLSPFLGMPPPKPCDTVRPIRFMTTSSYPLE